MSSTSDASCCKKSQGPQSCTKKDDETCTFTIMCSLTTPEGEFPCECICTCRNSSGNCNKCVCKCECTLEKAQKIRNVDGTVKYRCECECTC